ncbi:MAG: 23S rRNA (adenine(2503)-C(2))-methyltransferase RlmN [Minisyncoccales bacterium]
MFEEITKEFDGKKFRIEQFYHAIFRDLIDNTEEISTFSKDLRLKLRTKKLFKLKLHSLHESKEKDTKKAIFESSEGYKIESVLMRHQGRNTVCVSSQIGCPCACVFCATGKTGFKRNLDPQEIIEQVLFFNKELKKEYLINNSNEKWNPKNPPSEFRVRNVVFMGMGEPLLNFDNVLKTVEILNDDKKFGIGQRKITISTVGIIPKIKELAEKNMQLNLAVSLHSPLDEERSKIAPINKKYPLKELIKSLINFTAKTDRRIFFEFTVIKDINDNKKTAHDLGELFKNWKLLHINFIPLNENKESDLKKPSFDKIRKMQNILMEKYGIVSTVRREFGQDIQGACGQLAGES